MWQVAASLVRRLSYSYYCTPVFKVFSRRIKTKITETIPKHIIIKWFDTNWFNKKNVLYGHDLWWFNSLAQKFIFRYSMNNWGNGKHHQRKSQALKKFTYCRTTDINRMWKMYIIQQEQNWIQCIVLPWLAFFSCPVQSKMKIGLENCYKKKIYHLCFWP